MQMHTTNARANAETKTARMDPARECLASDLVAVVLWDPAGELGAGAPVVEDALGCTTSLLLP